MTDLIHGTEIVNERYVKLTTPRTSYYGKPVYQQLVHIVEVAYTQWIDMQLSGNVPKHTMRRVYLTKEEYIMFKLAGFMQEPERIVCSGHTYITG